MLLNDFFRWLRKKPQRVQMWLEDIPTFRPVVRQGRFVHIVRTPESEILAVSMALFKALLHFASARRAWISTEEAQKVLMAHWNLLLPESCPLGSKGDGVSAVCQDSRDALFQFMAEAIAARGDVIVPEGGSRTAETWGAVHSITSIRYLIFPRERFLSDYLDWLEHNGAAVPDRKDRWETQMQGKLLEWGIPVKTETKDTTWPFLFYERGHAPKGQKEKLPCLAFPVLQLPPKVLTALEKRFGCPFGTTVEPESVREGFELKTVEKWRRTEQMGRKKRKKADKSENRKLTRTSGTAKESPTPSFSADDPMQLHVEVCDEVRNSFLTHDTTWIAGQLETLSTIASALLSAAPGTLSAVPLIPGGGKSTLIRAFLSVLSKRFRDPDDPVAQRLGGVVVVVEKSAEAHAIGTLCDQAAGCSVSSIVESPNDFNLGQGLCGNGMATRF